MKFLYKFMIVVAIVMLISFIYLYNKNKENFESNDNIQVILFKMKGCSHCTQFLPEFNKFKENISNENKPVNVQIIDAEDDQQISKYNIKGFPTVLFIKNGQEFTYDGNRNAEDLMNYLNKMSF
jgi:thiol-disulfide isomerase/thioredoxin